MTRATYVAAPHERRPHRFVATHYWPEDYELAFTQPAGIYVTVWAHRLIDDPYRWNGIGRMLRRHWHLPILTMSASCWEWAIRFKDLDWPRGIAIVGEPDWSILRQVGPMVYHNARSAWRGAHLWVDTPTILGLDKAERAEIGHPIYGHRWRIKPVKRIEDYGRTF